MITLSGFLYKVEGSFTGTIGYLAVYNRSLSQEECFAVYEAIQDEMQDRGAALPELLPTPQYIAITLDDGNVNDYTNAYRLAAERGIPITSYIISSQIGTTGRLTWDQIYEMRAAGHGVEDHTSTHVNLPTLTAEQIHTQMQSTDSAFQTAGLPKPEHIAYPWGANNADTRAIVAEYRVTGRATKRRGSVPNRPGLHRIRSFEIGEGYVEDTATVNGWVDAAISGHIDGFLYPRLLPLRVVDCLLWDRFEEVSTTSPPSAMPG